MAFTKVTGTIELFGDGGSHTFRFDGSRPPATMKEIPAYVSERVALVLNHFNTSAAEIDGLRAKVKALETAAAAVQETAKTEQPATTRQSRK
jgi:hypothetical protein